jgi:trk system potassium uptake protein TrkH
VSTGGFSTYDNNIAGFNSAAVQSALMFFAFCGALPLPLFYILWRKGWRSFITDVELQGLVVAALVISVLLSTTLYFHMGDWRRAVFHGTLVGISAQTGTGFSTIDIADLPHMALLMLIFSMLVGGGTASTAGGIKILRLFIFLRLLQLFIQRTTTPPHAVTKPALGGHVIANEELLRAMILILLFIIVILLSWLIFLIYGHPPLPSLFEVVSATATVGLSTGISHHQLPSLLKGVLCVDMLLGRVEIIAFLVLLYYRTWSGHRVE